MDESDPGIQRISLESHGLDEYQQSINSLATTCSQSASSVPSRTLTRNTSETSLSLKYGKPTSIIGKGASALIKLCENTVDPGVKYAIKEFKKRSQSETKKSYSKRMMGEFCVASSLDHENIVKTFDLVQDDVHFIHIHLFNESIIQLVTIN